MKLTPEQQQRARELAEGLPELAKTEPHRHAMAGEADDYDLRTLELVDERFRWRRDGRPDLPEDIREEMVQADKDRERHEREAFAEGGIPPWLCAEFPGVMVFEDGSSMTNPEEGIKPPERDPNMALSAEEMPSPEEFLRFLAGIGPGLKGD